MGEAKVPVMVKMSPDEMVRFEGELRLWSPVVTKRGPMAELLILVGIAALDLGLVKRSPESVAAFLDRAKAKRPA